MSERGSVLSFSPSHVGVVHAAKRNRRLRLALIVSHPVQYFVPLYQRLAKRSDLEIKVFFTWHAGQSAVHDEEFHRPIAWDIPLTDGYEFELVPNLSSKPGTHHFFGLKNPSLVEAVELWRPDVVHLTGWAWLSHLQALRAFSKRRIPTLFRGDSHLLNDRRRGPRWWLKAAALSCIYTWPSAFLTVGSANRAYYEAFGVAADRLIDCPHSIDVRRFAEPSADLEAKSMAWRRDLGIADGACVVVYAGKFSRRKRPLELMRAIRDLEGPNVMLILVGGGELENEVRALASEQSARFRVLPFQNQSQMPLVYRLGDLCTLPSSEGETWGLAVNEAMACGRPVLVSDQVGCALDLIDDSCGRIFSGSKPDSLVKALGEMVRDRAQLRRMGQAAARRADSFDIACTEDGVMKAIRQVCST